MKKPEKAFGELGSRVKSKNGISFVSRCPECKETVSVSGSAKFGRCSNKHKWELR